MPIEAAQGRSALDYGSLMLEFVEQHHAKTGNWPTTSALRGSRVPRKLLPEVRDRPLGDRRLVKYKLPQSGGGAVFAIPSAEHAAS